MKIYQSLTLAALLLTAMACSNQPATEATDVASEVVMEAPTTLTVSIEGMTCAVGCAAAIQEGCSKLAGVGQSKVDFETKQGSFVYDAAKITEADVLRCIEGVNGGGVYKATVIVGNEDAEEIEAVHDAAPVHGAHS